MIVVDTSGLLSAIDADQRHHDAARSVLEADPGPFLLSPFVLAELDYLIAARVGVAMETAFLDEVSRGTYRLEPFDHHDVDTATRIIRRYDQLGLGLADASIVVLAGRYRTTRLLTLDERHFRAVRPLRGKVFSLLPLDVEPQ